MPIENERKFVLEDDGDAGAAAGRSAGRDAQLPAPGLSRCLGPAHPLDRGGRQRCATSSPTSGRSTTRWSRSRPRSAPIDFERLWSHAARDPAEGALLLDRRPLPLGRRLLQDRRRPDLLRPGRSRDAGRQTRCRRRCRPCLAPHLLAAGAGRDPRFTSKRLADRAMPRRLLADVREKGRRREDRAHRHASRSRCRSPSAAVTGRGPAHLDDQQHPAGAGSRPTPASSAGARPSATAAPTPCARPLHQ